MVLPHQTGKPCAHGPGFMGALSCRRTGCSPNCCTLLCYRDIRPYMDVRFRSLYCDMTCMYKYCLLLVLKAHYREVNLPDCFYLFLPLSPLSLYPHDSWLLIRNFTVFIFCDNINSHHYDIIAVLRYSGKKYSDNWFLSPSQQMNEVF